MRVLVSGGGTAGHVNAGIAIRDEFKKQDPNIELLFIGTKRGIEKDLIPKAGYKISYINSRGLNRESLPILFYSFLLIPFSICQSIIHIFKFKPDAVLGVGGFVSGPVLLSSALLGRSVFLLEQNAVMGLTNKSLSKFAKIIFSAFPLKAGQDILKKVVVCGNPVRGSIRAVTHKNNANKLVIFIFGGSQGARAINNCIIGSIQKLNSLKDIKIYHQTGKLDFEKVKLAYKDATFEHEVFDYTYEIHKIYEEADLVISRSGAGTVFELMNAGLPSILVPLPTAADNHQYYNARYLADKKSAIVIEQKHLNPDTLVENIKNLMLNRSLLDEMRKNINTVELKGKVAQQEIVKLIRERV